MLLMLSCRDHPRDATPVVRGSRERYSAQAAIADSAAGAKSVAVFTKRFFRRRAPPSFARLPAQPSRMRAPKARRARIFAF